MPSFLSCKPVNSSYHLRFVWIIFLLLVNEKELRKLNRELTSKSEVIGVIRRGPKSRQENQYL